MSQPDDRIDRYVRGELTAAEARELAQKALDDPELFDELTGSALAKRAVAGGSGGGKVIPFFRRPGRVILAGSIAAAIALVVVPMYVLRQERTRGVTNRAAPAATLDPARAGEQPVLLANLPAGPGEQPAVFRGAEAGSRAPKPSGAIVAIEGGTAEIDIGSIDGLSRGMELDVYRDNDTRPIGRLKMEAVFRERARGSIDGRGRTHDQVRVPPAVHLAARMEQVHALAARGDAAAARKAAEDAVQWAASNGVPSEAQVPAWNTLAVLRLLQADRAGGETLLQQALAACPRGDASYPWILNNLGALAETAGDRAKAREQYSSAMQALAGHGDEAQGKVIQSNLARVLR